MHLPMCQRHVDMKYLPDDTPNRDEEVSVGELRKKKRIIQIWREEGRMEDWGLKEARGDG